MSQLLATLYPSRFVPPEGAAYLTHKSSMPEDAAITRNERCHRPGSQHSKQQNLDLIVQKIREGFVTIPELSESCFLSKSMVSTYLRLLEAERKITRFDEFLTHRFKAN